MSLIEEALRRLKDPRIPGEPTPQGPAPHSWPTSRPSAQAPNALLGATAAIMALTAVFIAAGAFWMVRTLNPTPPPLSPVAAPPAPIPAVAEPPPPAPVAAAASEPAPEPSVPVKEPLMLTGIVEGEG